LQPYIEDGKTIVCSPHKLYGPQSNDLILQLRKFGIQKVILGGMLANMCVEAHARELLEQGFELVIAKDATAGPRHAEWGNGNVSADINFRYLSKDVLSTDEIIQRLIPARASEQDEQRCKQR
jgi:nicotinamidase-related amidase